MVAVTQTNLQSENQPPRQQLQRQKSIVQPTSSSAEEEALKRNIDCVYFLASPLTCKKGTDCEYRHSEYARVNPRDCWFWLNGNCLNPKCGYRHPPLDGLLGAQAAPGTPHTVVPSSQNTETPAMHTSHGPKAVPCVFFLQGHCLKGDQCLFLHGTNPSMKTPQVQGTKQDSEAQRQDKRVPHANVVKSAPSSSGAKPGVGAAARNKSYVDSVVPSHVSFSVDASRSKATSIPAGVNVVSGRRINLPHPPYVSDHQSLHNDKDSEEFLRESSPGFDVLVDDDLRASGDYYHNEDRYGKGEERLNPLTDYGTSAKYNDVHNHGRFQDSQAYSSHDHLPGTYPWDQCLPSSKRLSGGQAHVERRGYRESDSPENVVSDLRHHLSKRRRVNDLDERSISNRLRGRIKLPERSQINGGEENMSLSLERHQTSFHHGRHRDRMNERIHKNYAQEKNFRIQQMRKDMNAAGSSDFAGPRSLAELKADKHTENKEQPVLGKRKTFTDDHQQSVFASMVKEDANINVTENLVERNNLVHNQSSEGSAANENEVEDGITYNENLEDQDLEGDDQRDGVYNDQVLYEEDYPYDENVDMQEEDLDVEEGDAFAKKIGVILT